MNVGQWLVWGFVSTVVLTTLMAGSQALNLTRMNIPYLLGTMFTANRDRARLYGIALHLVNGWLFSLVYIVIFHAAHNSGILLGALIGIGHSLFVLTVLFPALPAMHPRMASETMGPVAIRRLEPPGFLGRHYGVRTPISIIFAHIVFGALLGGLY